MRRRKLLEKAASTVCEDRNQQYGRPETNFQRIADLWTAYTGHWITASDVASMMILMKVARIQASKGKSSDSWVDIAGYAACGSEIALGEEGDNVQC